jgi:hypothetical protein
VSEQKRLWPAQWDTARELPWYAAWLESTGRTVVVVEPPPPEPEGRERGYVGYRCRRREHPVCRGRWGAAHCTCPCHQEKE